MAVLDDVRTLLGFDDDERNDLLTVIIVNCEKRLLAYLPSTIQTVPEELEYIVTEIAIARYNRLGNENMASYSQEGESISYNDDDISPYLKEITAYCEKLEDSNEGVVRFI